MNGVKLLVPHGRVLVLLALWATSALAQQAKESLGVGEARPWAQGVSVEDQRAAQVLFEEGNGRLKDLVFGSAGQRYLQALRHWDHPAIHYNLALALMNLDQPIELHKHLVAAMAYGPEPLEQSRFEHAQGYKVLLEKQLAWVDITCEKPGATVSMNGKTLFVAPGRFKGFIRPGTHSIHARQDGYLPTDWNRTVMPSDKVTLKLELYTAEENIRYRRKWSQWIPWTVLGAGLATATGSAWMHSTAAHRFDTLDRTVAEACSPDGCPVSTVQMRNLRNQGNTLQTTAMVGYAVGGAALLTGAALLYLNRQEAYLLHTGAVDPGVSVVPLVGINSGGVVGTLRF